MSLMAALSGQCTHKHPSALSNLIDPFSSHTLVSPHLHARDHHSNALALAQVVPKQAHPCVSSLQKMSHMVAERGVWPHQEQIHEKICEQIADVHVPQVVEQIVEMPKMAEQILDVLVPEMVEQLMKLSKTVSVGRIQERTAEQSVDILVPQDVEELAEFFKASSLDRVQQSSVEQTVETPDMTLAEKIIEMPVTRKTQQDVNMCVQHLVNAVEVEKRIIQEKINQVIRHVETLLLQIVKKTVEVPEIQIVPAEIPELQFTDKVVDILVVAQRQIRMNQEVQKTIETPQLQCIDEMIDVPVVLVVQVPGARVVKKTVDNPQFKIAEKTVENPETQTTQSSDIQVSQVHVVMKTVETPRVQRVIETTEIPQLTLVKKIGVIPESIETPCIQGPQTSESLSVDSRGLSHQDCELLFHVNRESPDTAGGVHDNRDDLHAGNGSRTAAAAQNRSTQQRKQWQQPRKEEEEEKGREEREKGRKGQRGSGQEGKRKEKEREAEVKKDATGWTVVTRNKRQRKMVQIFVKVDEAKVTPMDVSLTDGKVEDVIRQVQKGKDVYVTMQGKVLRRNEKLKSCGVTDGCTIQVTSRMRGGGRHKDKRSKADTKRGMDESGQKDQQVESLIDKCQEATQAQKDEMIQLFEENDAYRRMFTMISEAEDEEHEIQRFGKQLQSGVDEERAKLMELGMRWAVEARKRGRGAEQEQRRQEEQRQRRHEEQGQNTGQEQGKRRGRTN